MIIWYFAKPSVKSLHIASVHVKDVLLERLIDMAISQRHECANLSTSQHDPAPEPERNLGTSDPGQANKTQQFECWAFINTCSSDTNRLKLESFWISKPD